MQRILSDRRPRMLILVCGFLLAFFIAACEKQASSPIPKVIDFTIINTQDFTFDFNFSGDEEGARIVVQAQHFRVSEIRRDTADYSVVFFFSPECDYEGTEYVKIETCTGGESTGCSEKIIYEFNFRIEGM